eukprot:SAG11_NODE_56_length_19295_cov_20.219675_19_plen_72_part_00
MTSGTHRWLVAVAVVLQKQQPSEVLGPSEKKKDKLQDKFLIQVWPFTSALRRGVTRTGGSCSRHALFRQLG